MINYLPIYIFIFYDVNVPFDFYDRKMLGDVF